MKKNIPKFMITYSCRACGHDFARAKRDELQCFYCNSKNKDGFEIIKKEKITPKVMAARLKLVTDRMMENLKKAFTIEKEGGFQKIDEINMLRSLAKADKLRKGVRELKLKGKRKK